MSTELLTHDDAAKVLLEFCLSGGIGSPEGKSVTYDLLEISPTTIIWSAGLAEDDAPPMAADRFQVEIDRLSKKVLSAQPISLQDSEIADIMMAATGQRLASAARFTDGGQSISYKVTVHDDPGIAYVVQLRRLGRVASMDFLMSYVAKHIDPRILPVPQVYPIPGELQRQEATGMGRQIAQFISGDMALAVYPNLSHEAKLTFLPRVALAMQACWRIPLPEPRMIGELIGDKAGGFGVAPDHHYSLGGPWKSVRKYLEEHVRFAFEMLEQQEGIEEYKILYLDRIKSFIDRPLDTIISPVVEDIPIVTIHADMGLHNIIVSHDVPADIAAVIDWEFIECAPYASTFPMIERMFRKPAPNLYGPDLDRGDELRNAFWDAIPEWKAWNETPATKEFLKWYMFAHLMKPEPPADDASDSEKEMGWQASVEVVESVLHAYGC